MAPKKQPERTTTGESYSGKHKGLRRQLTQSLQDYDEQDAIAAAEGTDWASWVRGLLKSAVGRYRKKNQ